MKTSSLLLIASLAANGALIVVLAPGHRMKSHLSSSSPRTVTGSPAIRSAVSGPKTSGNDAVRVPDDARATFWSHLWSDDLEEFKQRLMAAGFSNKEVRALLDQAITDREDARDEAIRGKWRNAPYWKSPYASLKSLDAKQRADLYASYHERQELKYQYVNGPDSLADDEDALLDAQRRFGRLPLEKLQRLTALDHDFQRARSELFAPQNEGEKFHSPSMQTMRDLQQAHLAQAAQFLSPDEVEQYELRNSSESRSLSLRLASFRPSEDEFKAIYAIEKQSASYALFAQSMGQLKAELGPDRFAEYSVALTSDGSGALGKLIARLELPLTTVTTVNAVRDDINSRAKAVNADRTLTSVQRQIQLDALAAEAREKLVSSLGDRGFRAYSDLKGSWLRALKPSHP
jgi:hypothetical protein